MEIYKKEHHYLNAKLEYHNDQLKMVKFLPASDINFNIL